MDLNEYSALIPINISPLHKLWTYTDFEINGRSFDAFGYIEERNPLRDGA
jgi:hypothetical protein